MAFEEWWVFVHPPIFPLYVEFVCWTVHLLARKNQSPCQVNDVCGVSGFCTWLWMLRFIRCNYREGEARSVFCLFHAPVDFLIQRQRRMHTWEAPAFTRLLNTSGHHHRERQRREGLGPQSSSSKKTWFFFQSSGCFFAVDFHFTDAAQSLFLHILLLRVKESLS